ncbi:AMP-binding protein [Caballeronia sp. GACF4]|uniref:AMP-binding protein n=1 Tax=Caballeronia sp. GACF4 TaxID=2921763 RepID=UPI0020282931|nr:AMP-binding protein [Caballeronia sp. GACF4]
MNVPLVSRQYSQRTALIAEDGRMLTYEALHASIGQLAADLPARQLVFIVGENDLPTVLCYLAALERGAVPLLLSRSIHASTLGALYDAYRPAQVLIARNAAWAPPGATLVREMEDYGLYDTKAKTDGSTPALHADLAMLLATSGSTGSPKLVRLTATNLVANATSIVEYLGLTPDERAITSLPLNYSYGLSVLNSHLRAGASVVLTNRSLMDAAFWRTLNAYGATSLAGVPYSYDMLLRLRLARIDMPSVRTLTQAGGRMRPEKLRDVAQICEKRGIRFFAMYGQTEATARIAYLTPADAALKPASIGQAIPGGRLSLERADGSVIETAGETGELIYAGANVSMGYAECAADFALPDVNRGTLRTGDLAHFDEDGAFFIEGRLHRFLKVFGIRVSLDAVEQLAAELGFECAANGTDERLVIHAVAPDSHSNSEAAPSVAWAQSLRSELAQRIGVHASAIVVKPLAALPRLPAGKVDHACLASLS